MPICWYCSWGWPKEVWDIFNQAKEKFGGDDSKLCYGPAHIVWADENFERHHVEWCLQLKREQYNDFTDEEFSVVMDSLKKLLELPDDIRECEPDDYDGEHPEAFPPKNGIKTYRKYI